MQVTDSMEEDAARLVKANATNPRIDTSLELHVVESTVSEAANISLAPAPRVAGFR